LVTATSILLVLTTRKILENMRRTGHLRVMMDSFFNSGVVFLLSLIGSLASLLMHGCYLIYGTIISIGLLFLAIQLFIIGGYRFYRIISFISSHQAP
jgi:hypothetical protein